MTTMTEVTETVAPVAGQTPRFKEREFIILAVIAALYAWGTLSDNASEDQMEALQQMLIVAVPGFQISRGLAKKGA